MKRRILPIVILTLSLSFGGTHPLAAEAPDHAQPSVTIFPVILEGNRNTDDNAKRVGFVIATLLERAGLEDLEVAKVMFNPPETDEFNEIIEAFGKHVREKRIKTDYAVFTQIVGTPRTGVKEIRTIVVDKEGKVRLAESAGKAQLEKAPLRPKDPMSCCIFVGRRLQELWKLEDPLRPNAPEGKMSQFWKKDAGIPEKDELDAITKRMEILKKNIKTATCTLYPVHVGQHADKECSVALVAMLNKSGLCKAEASATDVELKIGDHSNEQKVLWDTAQSFRDYVKKNRPATDYAAYIDYGLYGTNVRYVHVIICDQSGNWVLIDMQNSHHPDFKRIHPKSAADCNRLLIVRLKGWLSESM